MPSGVVKTKRDEAKWNKAKGIIHKQYPDLSEDDDSFWKLVQSIYKNMKKAINNINTQLLQKAVEISFLCPTTPKDKRSFILDNYYLLSTHINNLHKARRLQGRMKLHGLDISIENRRYSVRRGVDSDGHEWSTKMKYPYGYIRLTEGNDGEHVDVYIGDNKESRKVYVIHQVNPYKKERPYDEDKVMLGFDSADEAKEAYQMHYDRPDFFGNMEEWDIDNFKEHVKKKKGKITGGKKLNKAVKVKTSYSKEDLKAKNLRWITVRGNHVLVQGLEDGSWVVVGGAGGKLNHFKIDRLLSKEEYKQRAEERKKAQATKEISPEQMKEQVEERKKEVELKRTARSQYEQTVKDILNISKEGFKSLLTVKQMDEIEEMAIDQVKKRRRVKEITEDMKKDIEKEKEKIVKDKETEAIKDAEKKAVDTIATEFFGDQLDPSQKRELRTKLDVEKAMDVLKARKMFRKVLKDIGTTKLDKIEPIKIGQTFGADSTSISKDILDEVEKHVETQKNIQLYDNLNAQSLNMQKQVDLGVLTALNGVSGDLFGTGAVFSDSVIESLGLEACVSIVAAQLEKEKRVDVAKEALAEFARKNNYKTVDSALKESKRRFNYADKIRKMADDKSGSTEAILSKASANGYALRQILRSQQVIGTAVGQLRAVAHLMNRLDEGVGDVVQTDMGKNLLLAKKKARKAGFKRGEYKITSKDGRFIMEISKDNLEKFFSENSKLRKTETKLDKIKMHKENSGYKPPGIKDTIKFDPAQEAGHLFWKEVGKGLLDFEAGLGKTGNAYMAAMEAIHNMGVKKVLFVVPAKLRSQMNKERKVFLDADNQKLVKLNDKGPKDRKEVYKSHEGIVIIGHDQLRTDYKEIKEAGFGLIVIDEIHEITNPEKNTSADSGRFKGMMALKDIPFKLAMSGTNIKNSKAELYKKINFLDPDHTLGTLSDFEKKYKGLNQGTGAFQNSANDSFRRDIAPYVFTQKSKLGVKNHIHEVSIELSPEQKKLYKKSEDIYSQERSKKKKGAAARRESRNYDIIHDGEYGSNSKISNIIDIMEKNHKGEKAVIHVYRRKALAAAVKALEAKYGKGCCGIIHGDTPKGKADKIKEEFNDPGNKLRFIIGTKSLEAGHNLQFGGTVTFHLDIPNTAAAFDQRNKRIYRKKQTRDTHTYLLQSESPFDFSKKDIMERKEREMQILGNPSDIEAFDETGFMGIINKMEGVA